MYSDLIDAIMACDTSFHKSTLRESPLPIMLSITYIAFLNALVACKNCPLRIFSVIEIAFMVLSSI